MENYEKLKEIIQQANPEIMKLTFGCEIQTDKWSFGAIEIISATIHGEFMTWECSCRGKQELKREEITKILGRPIRLADVLLTINKNTTGELIYTVADVGYFGTIGEIVQGLAVTWDFRNDNLDNQSEETKQFLIDLLTK